MKAVRRLLNRVSILIIAYFIIALVFCQVIMGIFALVNRTAYDRAGFYLDSFFGTNVLVSALFIALSYQLRFCKISRVAAWTELAFAINWVIIKEDNLYNILFQVIGGTAALIATYLHFINKFPLCKLSLIHKLFASLFASLFTGGGCEKGIDNYQKNIESTIKQAQYAKGQYRAVD